MNYLLLTNNGLLICAPPLLPFILANPCSIPYSHPMFQRDRTDLVDQMTRSKKKSWYSIVSSSDDDIDIETRQVLGRRVRNLHSSTDTMMLQSSSDVHQTTPMMDKVSMDFLLEHCPSSTIEEDDGRLDRRLQKLMPLPIMTEVSIENNEEDIQQEIINTFCPVGDKSSNQ